LDKVDSEEDRGKCIKQLARNAKKNVKSLSNQERIARYTAKSAIQSTRMRAAKGGRIGKR